MRSGRHMTCTRPALSPPLQTRRSRSLLAPVALEWTLARAVMRHRVRRGKRCHSTLEGLSPRMHILSPMLSLLGNLRSSYIHVGLPILHEVVLLEVAAPPIGVALSIMSAWSETMPSM